MSDAGHTWNTAPSGTAGGTITFTTAMTLGVNGALGIGSTTLTGYSLRVSKNITGATTAYGIAVDGAIQSDVTSSARLFWTLPSIPAGSAVTDVYHYITGQGLYTGTVTNQYGFVASSSLTGGTNNYGFWGNVPSGTNRWNLYMNGTANNYMAGDTSIGTTTGGYKLNVNGTFNVTGTATFSGKTNIVKSHSDYAFTVVNTDTNGYGMYLQAGSSTTDRNAIDVYNAAGTTQIFKLTGTGAATFSSSVTAGGDVNITTGAYRSQGEIVLRRNGNEIRMGSGDASDYLVYYAGAAERMRITSTGNIGINTTTISNPNSLDKVLEIKSAGPVGIVLNDSRDASPIGLENRGAVFYLTYGTSNILVADGASGKVGIGTASPSNLLDIGTPITNALYGFSLSYGATNVGVYQVNNATGELKFGGAAAGYFPTFYSGGSERMRITSAGKVLIGKTTASAVARNLEVQGQVAATAGSVITEIDSYSVGGTNLGFIGTQSNHDLVIKTNDAERLRITSGGQISQTTSIADWSHVITNASTTSPNGIIIQYTAANKNNTSNPFLYCTDNSGTTLRFEVRSNGGIANYATNNVILSDVRLKKDITPLESVWDKLKNIEIVKYKFKDQTHNDFNMGVIAQQVEKIAPELVELDGWGTLAEDGTTYKGIYETDINYYSIKALQEAMVKIEYLEKELNILKNK
jgi:hypothetical protein